MPHLPKVPKGSMPKPGWMPSVSDPVLEFAEAGCIQLKVRWKLSTRLIQPLCWRGKPPRPAYPKLRYNVPSRLWLSHLIRAKPPQSGWVHPTHATTEGRYDRYSVVLNLIQLSASCFCDDFPKSSDRQDGLAKNIWWPIQSNHGRQQCIHRQSARCFLRYIDWRYQ